MTGQEWEQEWELAQGRLQELLDELPRMQKKREELVRAIQAQKVEAEEKRYYREKQEMERQQKKLVQMAQELRELQNAQSEEELARRLELEGRQGVHLQGMSLRQESFMGVYGRYRDQMKRNGFSCEEDYLASKRTEEQREVLQQEIAAYQKDYAQALEKCELLDELAAEEE